MADFNVQVDSPLPTGPQGGSGNTGSSGARAASAALDTVASGLSIFQTALSAQPRPSAAAQRQAASQTVVSGYITTQQDIADAVNSGQMTEDEGAVRSRALFRQTVAQSPEFGKDISAAHKEYVSPSLGPLVQEASQASKDRKAQRDAAIADGAINTTASAEVQERQLKEYNAWRAAESNLEALQTMDKIEGRRAFNEYTSRYLKTRQTGYGTVTDNPDLTMDQRLVNIETMHNRNLNEVAQVAIYLDNESDVEFATSILQREYDTNVRLIKGEMSKEAATAELNNIKALTTLDAVNSSPLMKRLLAVSEMGFDGEALLLAGPDVAAAISGYLVSASQDTAINISDQKPAKAHLDSVMMPSIAQWKAGALSDEGNAQLFQNMSAAIKGTDFVHDAKAGRDYISYIANPDIGDYMLDVTSETFDVRLRARDVIQGVYGSELGGLVRNEIDPNDSITAEWDSGGVRFKGTPPSKAFRLNKTAAPLINEYVRGMSHLSGTKDYRAWWEENKPAMFPEQTNMELRQAESARLQSEFTQQTGQTGGPGFVEFVRNNQRFQVIAGEEPIPGPQPGDIIGGFTFQGGDPRQQSNWVRADG